MKRRTYFIIHAFIIMLLMCMGLASSMEHQKQTRQAYVVNREDDHDIQVEDPFYPPQLLEDEVVAEAQEVGEESYVLYRFSKDWGSTDTYLLAKIVECEAGNQSLECREKIAQVVLNRVWDAYFPNSIKEVIFQNNGDLYQFTPVMPGSSWWYTEPSALSYQAIENVMKKSKDDSQGALYFEACEGSSWHSRNLEFLYQIDDTRFYR